MERVFKIKSKSNRDPRAQYPSERRYSASTVIGVSVVYFQLCLFSILMGSLLIYRLNMPPYAIADDNQDDITHIKSEDIDVYLKEASEKIEEDLDINTDKKYFPMLICVGCFFMALGYFSSFVSGIFAWKQWYVDYHIIFFLVTNALSAIASSFSCGVLTCTFGMIHWEINQYKVVFYPLTASLAMNIFILSIIGFIWSTLSCKIAFRGMQTNYPDDINFSQRQGRHVEVSTVKKGNKNANVYPPDIISHFPVTDKLAKYLPKKDTSNLPKAESNIEYQQRVDKFLSSEPVFDAN